MSLACPTCGGQMQATAKLYLTISREGALDVQGLNVDEVSYHCENDHPANPALVRRLDEATNEQWVRLRDWMEAGL